MWFFHCRGIVSEVLLEDWFILLLPPHPPPRTHVFNSLTPSKSFLRNSPLYSHQLTVANCRFSERRDGRFGHQTSSVYKAGPTSLLWQLHTNSHLQPCELNINHTAGVYKLLLRVLWTGRLRIQAIGFSFTVAGSTGCKYKGPFFFLFCFFFYFAFLILQPDKESNSTPYSLSGTKRENTSICCNRVINLSPWCRGVTCWSS